MFWLLASVEKNEKRLHRHRRRCRRRSGRGDCGERAKIGRGGCLARAQEAQGHGERLPLFGLDGARAAFRGGFCTAPCIEALQGRKPA